MAFLSLFLFQWATNSDQNSHVSDNFYFLKTYQNSKNFNYSVSFSIYLYIFDFSNAK